MFTLKIQEITDFINYLVKARDARLKTWLRSRFHKDVLVALILTEPTDGSVNNW